MLHALIQPVNSYQKMMVHRVEDWLRVNAGPKVQLPEYHTDHVQQQVVRTFVTSHQYGDHSNYRAKIFASVENKESLTIFAARMVANYQKSTLDEYTRKGIYAQIALARQVVRAIQSIVKKGDETNFWKRMDRELQGLVQEHGTDHLNAGWAKWYETIVVEEEAAYIADLKRPVKISEKQRKRKRYAGIPLADGNSPADSNEDPDDMYQDPDTPDVVDATHDPVYPEPLPGGHMSMQLDGQGSFDSVAALFDNPNL
ncbi:hypothetical protein BC834DRAFT_970984 [Gloeopeniophorella convolvens]|nr:hypothetical protein BC834DRAFT_970984 [Gloeopeniophorella convolvens]